MDKQNTESLINEIREFLESSSDEQRSEHADSDSVDLYTLCSELIALKTEVKIEARQFRSALEKFSTALESLEQEKLRLSEQLEQSRKQAEVEKKSAQRALLLQILDLYDRVDAGLAAAESFKPKWYPWSRKKKERNFIRGLRDGQQLTLERIVQLLAFHDVFEIKVSERQFDPETMHATEIEHHSEFVSGTVNSELRKGFRWGREVLRTAEVKVCKSK